MNPYDLLLKFKQFLIVKGYGTDYYERIKPFIKYVDVNKVDLLKFQYDDYMKYLLEVQGKGYSKGYINNLIKAVRKFFDFLVESNTGVSPNLREDVLMKFRLYTVDKVIKNSLTRDELDRMIAMGETVSKNMYSKIRVVFYFLYYTGLRKNEFLNLRRGDINIDENFAIIRIPTKNRMERKVYFPKFVAKMLTYYFQIEQEEQNAFNICSNTLEYWIHQTGELADIGKKITIHSFRHSFAQMLARKGVDIRVAQKLMGHRNLESTMIYYDPTERTVQEIYKSKVCSKKRSPIKGLEE